MIVKAFQVHLQSTIFHNKWLTAESLLKLIKQQCSFDDIGGLTEMQLNKALEAHCAHLESGNLELNNTGFLSHAQHHGSLQWWKDVYQDEMPLQYCT